MNYIWDKKYLKNALSKAVGKHLIVQNIRQSFENLVQRCLRRKENMYERKHVQEISEHENKNVGQIRKKSGFRLST